ncbi:hypothetical protein [Jeotgalibacillus haloalkalitolerans]|uniref:Uncharacterized protein n=1 Tax=Jeotgalibacillus haloalkalitolerans TaxID=3104292 RepID=A0ABU5KQZ9_9BACL|nr:hypothetical protein [Jeotgalibacillus sp. HH7-29]MDZ5713675.1 hypothetical protein [Jeotgalibacillus sp. HH7-29]
MIQLEWEQAKKNAKKHKKLFEDMVVHPNSVKLNGAYYFEANYLKKRTDHAIGKAIISGNGGNEEDAKKVHDLLITFHHTIIAIFTSSDERSRISPVFYDEALKVSERGSGEKIENGKAVITEMGELLKYLKVEYKKVTDFISGSVEVTEEAHRFLTDQAARLTACQINMIRLSADFDGILADWKEEMKEQGLWNELSRETQNYYHGTLMPSGNKISRDLYNGYPELPDGSLEEQAASLDNAFQERHAEWIVKSRSLLRWPKV